MRDEWSGDSGVYEPPVEVDELRPARRGIGCGTIIALSFVGTMWVLISLMALGRALVTGWPGMLKDEGFLALGFISVIVLVIAIAGRDEILKCGEVACPRCKGTATMGRYRAWQFIVIICFFPIGLLALLAGREPTRCPHCRHTW